MVFSEFVLTDVKGKNALDWVFFADVTVTTESGCLWWKKKKSERRKVTREYCGSWHFVDTGEFCPGSQVDALARAYEANQRLKDGR